MLIVILFVCLDFGVSIIRLGPILRLRGLDNVGSSMDYWTSGPGVFDSLWFLLGIIGSRAFCDLL